MAALPTNQAPAIHVRTLVLPGGRVEVSSAKLKEGETVDVDIRRTAASPGTSNGRNALDAIESLGGHRIFKSASEVDAHVEEERNSWR